MTVLNTSSDPINQVNGFTVEPGGFVAKARDQWKIHRNPPGVPMGVPRKIGHLVESNLPNPIPGVYYIVNNDVYEKLKPIRDNVFVY